MTKVQNIQASRRAFFGLVAGGLATAAAVRPAQAAKIRTNACIVIIGAGAAGAALVNRLVDRLEGAAITILDPSAEHLYQPGLSLVAAGLRPASYTMENHRLAAQGHHIYPRGRRRD